MGSHVAIQAHQEVGQQNRERKRMILTDTVQMQAQIQMTVTSLIVTTMLNQEMMAYLQTTLTNL